MSKTFQTILLASAVVGLTACSQLGTMAGLQAPAAPGEPGAASEPSPSTPSGGSSPSGSSQGEPAKPAAEAKPSAPMTVSVSIRSACPKTAKVFYGDKPKYGSGTSSTVSSNSVSNKTFRPGDMMWVVDEKDEGLASVKVVDGMKEVEIGSDCKSIKSR